MDVLNGLHVLFFTAVITTTAHLYTCRQCTEVPHTRLFVFRVRGKTFMELDPGVLPLLQRLLSVSSCQLGDTTLD